MQKFDDVTSSMRLCRECSRWLWNSVFKPHVDEVTFDDVDVFKRICANVINLMVFDSSLYQPSGSIWPNLWLTINSNYDVIPVLSRRLTGNDNAIFYWDGELKNIHASTNPRFEFIEFFDWDVRGFREIEFFRVRLNGAQNENSQPLELLIKPEYLSAYLEDSV